MWALGIRPVYPCLKSTFRRVDKEEWSPYSLHISFHFLLCVDPFESDSINISSSDSLAETAKKLRTHPQTSECLGQIHIFRLYCMIYSDGSATAPVSLLTSSTLTFSPLPSQFRAVVGPSPASLRHKEYNVQTMGPLWRYAYLLLPLGAGWAARPWCWLPDKEQAGQSEDSQHQS